MIKPIKDSKTAIILIGPVAKTFIDRINLESFNINLSTTTRSKTFRKTFKEIKYQNYLFDMSKYDKNLIPKLKEADHILISIPPVAGEDIVVKLFSTSQII